MIEKPTISMEELKKMGKMLWLPLDQPDVDEKIRATVEGWYNEMMPFTEKMMDQKYDAVCPANMLHVKNSWL